jgi:Tfp pilus assembly protein PilN
VRPVNLLPQGQRPVRGGGRPGSAYVVVGALAVLLVAAIAYVLTGNQAAGKRDELEAARQATAAATSRAEALGAYADFARVRAQREQSVRTQAEGRIDWERLVRELSRVLPADTYVTQLDAAASGQAGGATGSGGSSGSTGPGGASPAATGQPNLVLQGCAPSQEQVAVVLVRLRRLHNASDVSLADSARAGSEGGAGGDCGRGYAFNATVTFEPSTQPGDQRAPKHLGGGA